MGEKLAGLPSEVLNEGPSLTERRLLYRILGSSKSFIGLLSFLDAQLEPSAEKRINVSLRHVTDDHSEFSAVCADGFALDGHPKVRIIVMQIRNLCYGPEVHSLAGHGVSSAREMAHHTVSHVNSDLIRYRGRRELLV